MERLTYNEVLAKQYYPNENIDNEEIFNKLGKLEDLQDELGIPLEVLFKALKEGFWFKDSGRVFFAKQAGVFNGVSGTYWFSGIDTMVKVKDYGKTWWLEKPEVNENE